MNFIGTPNKHPQIYSGTSVIRTSLIQTPVWEPTPIPQQKVTHLYGNSVIRTVSLGTEVSKQTSSNIDIL